MVNDFAAAEAGEAHAGIMNEESGIRNKGYSSFFIPDSSFSHGYAILPLTMTKLTQDQVRHIARLARLRLREDEVEKYANELTKILGFIEQLSEVDTKNVEPTAQVTGMQNRFRDDEMGGIGTSPDALLHVSPLPIVDHQIVTPSAHG